jgi:predicted amidohydrolase YtcJ
VEQGLERIRVASQQKPSGNWIIIAGGWVPEQFQDGIIPSQEQLLKAAGSHPLYIQKLYSSVFVSPRGLEALEPSLNSELLSRFDVELNKSGDATGWWNGSARTISDLFDYLPKITLKTQYESTKLFFKELNRHGVTGVYDPGGYNFPLESYASLWKLHSQKELSIRIAYSLSAPKRGSELADFKKIMQGIPKNDAMLKWNGIGENVTWGMYNNESPTVNNQKSLQKVLEWAAKEKITVTLHWNNNESISRLLDVIDRVQLNYSIKDLRWSIAHINNIDEITLMRMKKNHLGWLAQNALYFQANNFADKYGVEALTVSPRLRQAINLNIPVGLGTDAHRVMDFNPFVAIEWLITGKGIDGRNGRQSSQLLNVSEALDLYTKGSAYFLPDGNLRGELSVGKYADLAILNQNIFTISTEQIHQTQSELTMVGGKVVYSK